MNLCKSLSQASFRCLLIGAYVTVASFCAGPAQADETIARTWNEELLHAISIDTARPTVHARNLYHLATAMYDSWAAYDDVADQVMHHEHATAVDVEAARRETISFAAYNLISHRFVNGPGGTGPGKDVTEIAITLKMLDLGYDPSFTSTDGDSPAALGNRIAQSVINATLNDGARETANYTNPPGWEPVNDPLTFEEPGTTMNDPNRWQPLHFTGERIDQFGQPISEKTQVSLSPYWGEVTPFAMKPSDRSGPYNVYHDQGPPPQLGGVGDADFKANAVTMIRYSSTLDPSQGAMIDISPVTRGNSPLGSYTQVGYTENPYTGQPYEQELVNEADFSRIMAEFWADGPNSTAPPGHWHELANYTTDRMEQLGIPKRIRGSGPVVDDLTYDIVKYLAVGGAVHDAAVAAWNHKGYYDYVRPISFVRYMGQLGQSSDPEGPSYHPDGLPLEPGLIEVVTAADTGVGGKFEHLAGNEGEIAIYAWKGPVDAQQPFETDEVSGVDWILAENWLPYQLASFVTPPFPGYVSGHSTFSRAGAEVLTALTGTKFFPGGLGVFLIEEGTGLDFEYGPSADVELQWATFFDASDQAALSRIYGGIHPPADDLPARFIGSMVGQDAWTQALRYFRGVPEPSSFALAICALGGFAVYRRRG
jgi:hypothetical protein